MAQRTPLPEAGWIGNVHHGLPAELHHLGGGGDYLAFVGRVSPEKGLDRAIEIAARVGMRLVIAAKIDRADREYCATRIAPLLEHAHVEYLGELGEADKGALLRGARALVFPIDWPEPFGLVMIEAMACGTPVIAFRRGSVPEVIEDGVTGFVVDSIEEATAALERVDTLSRAAIRNRFEARFTSARMARDYVDIYHHIAQTTDARDRSSGEPGLLHPGHELARG
jgi:glycosyltransferase involved in cell wall biosynthesis